MTITKGYGYSIEKINKCTPNDLKPFENAHELNRKVADYDMWLQGMYNYVAFQTVMAQFGAGLSGKSVDVEYLNTPFSQMQGNAEMTEEEKMKKVEMLFTSLEIQKFNFESTRNNKDNDKGGE